MSETRFTVLLETPQLLEMAREAAFAKRKPLRVWGGEVIKSALVRATKKGRSK